eukprot:scaffold143056_cov31-Tisochrysis_lutea.AAC.4
MANAYLLRASISLTRWVKWAVTSRLPTTCTRNSWSSTSAKAASASGNSRFRSVVRRAKYDAQSKIDSRYSASGMLPLSSAPSRSRLGIARHACCKDWSVKAKFREPRVPGGTSKQWAM